MEKQKKKQAKSSGRKWDGRSRISNDTYRKRWNEIFGKRKGNVVGKISSTQKKTSNLPPKK